MEYEILQENDISYAKTKRYVYYVVPKPNPTDKELISIFNELDKKLKKPFKRGHDEVTVFFFKDKSDFGKMFNLAKLERTKKRGRIIIERR
jgi:hypothetical protein